MTRRSHREWFAAVSELRAELAAAPTDLELAKRLWDLLSGSAGFDVRSGRLAIDTFGASALQTEEGLRALVAALRELAEETSEYPRAALFDPPLENRLRIYLRQPGCEFKDDIQWILELIDEEQ